MKVFWDNLFYDMDECGIDREEFASKAGTSLRCDLTEIENAIMDYDLKKALALIKEAKNEY